MARSTAREDNGLPPGGRIERVLILANPGNPEIGELAARLTPWLERRVDEVVLERDPPRFCEEREARALAGDFGDAPDLVVVLGGDGAMLGAVRAFALDPVPVLGINFGRVGFLASTTASHWVETLEGVLAGEGILERRMRLHAEWETDDGPKSAIALNDFVLQRDARQGLLTARLDVDDSWMTNYRADGVIVATPSGSTAYALAAGGPILEPSVPGLVVTSICSTGLSNRPIVIHADALLRLTVAAGEGVFHLVVDGHSHHPLHVGSVIRLRGHRVPYPIYVMPELDPYRRLRSRLGWGLAWKDEEA